MYIYNFITCHQNILDHLGIPVKVYDYVMTTMPEQINTRQSSSSLGSIYFCMYDKHGLE
jgi:hypothetical protein